MWRFLSCAMGHLCSNPDDSFGISFVVIIIVSIWKRTVSSTLPTLCIGMPPSTNAAIDFLNVLIHTAQGKAFDAVLADITDITATDGRLQCRLRVAPNVANRFGGLHGGCIATIVDTVGTAALVTAQTRTGVSTHISVDYLAPAPIGTVVDIDAQVVKAGRSVSLVRVTLTNTTTGKTVAVGTHQKFVGREDTQLASEVQRAKL